MAEKLDIMTTTQSRHYYFTNGINMRLKIHRNVNGLIICLLTCFFITGCNTRYTTRVVNKSENEIWVDEFKFGEHQLPVGILLPGNSASHITSAPIADSAYFRWRTINDEKKFEDTVEIKRPFPPLKGGQRYYIIFEIDEEVQVLIETEPY